MKLSKMLLSLFSIAALGSKADHPGPGALTHRQISLVGTDQMNCSVVLNANISFDDSLSASRIVHVEHKGMAGLLNENNFALMSADPSDRSQTKSVVYPPERIHDHGDLAVAIYSNLTLSAPAAVNFTLCLLAFANSTLSRLPKVLRAAAQKELTHEVNEDITSKLEFLFLFVGAVVLAMTAAAGYNRYKRYKQDAEARQPLVSRGESYGSVSEGVRSDMAAFETEEARSSSPRR